MDGDGVARLAELEAKHGPLPPTLRTNTAHGQHVFLRWPADLPRPIGQMFGYVTRWGSGSNAGYVIGPRSVHASGAVYAPATGTLTVAEIPEAWARAAVAAPTTTDLATITITGGYALPERVPAGAARYPEIVRYTAHLYDTSRLTVAEMWPLVRDVLAPRFADPLTQEQLRDRFDRAVAKMEERLGERRHVPPAPADPATFPQPENRGQATLSDLGEVEYVEDLIRPGRIVVWAAEEGSGKSFAVSGELAIRVAAAGGTFAGTWPVIQRGRVLVLSEMHPDDDYAREETILDSLGLDRRALDGTYFRLDLMRAAGGKPALTVPEWRDWITGWLTEHEAILMVIDTATGATQVDPWGHAIQEVYANLRLMLSRYPYLAVILIVHVRKPAGRGAGGRQLSDVLGEWGRLVRRRRHPGERRQEPRPRQAHHPQARPASAADRGDEGRRAAARRRRPRGHRQREGPRGGRPARRRDPPGRDVRGARRGPQGLQGHRQAVRRQARRPRPGRPDGGAARVPRVPRRRGRGRPQHRAAPDRCGAAEHGRRTAAQRRACPGTRKGTRSAARSTATQTSGAAVDSEGADRSIRPPHLKVGEVRRSDAAPSPHRASTHAAVAPQDGIPAGIGRRADGSIWCQFFRDHQTQHENVSSDPRCRICSPEEPA